MITDKTRKNASSHIREKQTKFLLEFKDRFCGWLGVTERSQTSNNKNLTSMVYLIVLTFQSKPENSIVNSDGGLIMKNLSPFIKEGPNHLISQEVSN